MNPIYSAANSYARLFPGARFCSGDGPFLTASDGRRFLDFVSGCGSLPYGHADPAVREAMIGYLEAGCPLQAMDAETPALEAFLGALRERVLLPRGMDHRVMLCGPTGADAVEAALKVARAATGRATVACLSGAYHGVTMGALSVTDSAFHRGPPLPIAGLLPGTFRVQHPEGPEGARDTLAALTASDRFAPPRLAAVIVEVVQGEGGVRPLPGGFLGELREWCDHTGTLLIADEVQAGVGRCGSFFSFDGDGAVPDVICLSKAIGAGSPLSLILVRPEFDVLRPGQHCGTFRGNQLALVAGEAALRRYWSDGGGDLMRRVRARGRLADGFLNARAPLGAAIRSRGLMIGADLRLPGAGADCARRCFSRGLLVESCGPRGEVVKLLPPLTISEADLTAGLTILASVLPPDVGEHLS